MISSILFVALVGTAVALPVGDQMDHQALRLLNLGKANDDFGLNLLDRLERAEKYDRATKHVDAKNLMISPFSVSTVMSMVLAGANNETHEQIFKTLGFDKKQFSTDSDIFTAYKDLIGNLRHQLGLSDKRNELQIANSIALQKNAKVFESFLKTITNSFEANIFAEDFVHQAHQATENINKWVADKTNGKIEKLFSSDLNPNTVMVLLNAIYFKGAWKTRFEKERTTVGQFHVDLEKTTQAQIMNLKGHFRFGFFDDGEMVEIPYQNDALSMLVFLPNQRWVKDYQTIASQFGRSTEHGSFKLSERYAQLRNVSVNIHLPKFKIESEFSLRAPLNAMGIRTAFSTTADFSKINGAHDLYLSEVAHKTFIEVNEEGAEAAAVTGAVVESRSMTHHFEFNANRPFLFLIRDNTNHLTLFAGVVNKP